MQRAVGFESLHNVRDLGGISGPDRRVVRRGLLYRGDQPHFATEADKRALFGLGVRKVIDFRSHAEHEDKPDPDIPHVQNIYLPIIQDVRVGITHGERENARIGEMLMSGADIDPSFVDAYMQDMYRQFVNDSFACGQYARFVSEVAESARAGEGMFWHCTAGKDRAGFAAVIVLEALGVDRDAIVADYVQTNESLKGFTEGLISQLGNRIPTDAAKEALVHFFRADESYLAAAYDEAERLYGGFAGYLSEAIRVGEAERSALRDLLLVRA